MGVTFLPLDQPGNARRTGETCDIVPSIMTVLYGLSRGRFRGRFRAERVAVGVLAAVITAAARDAQAAERWCERGPLTILGLHTFAGEIERLAAPEAARRKAALLFNTDTLQVHTLIHGMDDRGFFFRTPLMAKENPDFLKEFLPEARKRALRTTL